MTLRFRDRAMKITFGLAVLAPNLPMAQTPTESIPWKSEYIESKTIKLESDKSIGEYTVHHDGTVAVSVGAKGGAITAPLCHWKITKSGVLNIVGCGIDPDQVSFSFTLESINGNLIVVRDAKGERSTYYYAN